MGKLKCLVASVIISTLLVGNISLLWVNNNGTSNQTSIAEIFTTQDDPRPAGC